MDHAEIKALAVEAIAGFRASAANDPASYAGGRVGQADARDAADRLLAMLERDEDVPNPDYRCQARLAAALVTLAAIDHDAYAALLGPVAEAYKGSVAPGTVSGLVTMGNFLAAIGDDHDWSADMSGDGPVIRYQGHIAAFAPTLSPLTMLAVLEPMLDRNDASPRP